MAANFFDQFDPASAKPDGGGKSGNYFDQFDPGSAMPEPAGGTASDLAKSLKVGTQRLPGMVTGLADLPFALAAGARPFTKAADALGEVTGFQPGKWADETKFSAGYEQGKKAVDDAWKDGSAGDIALAYLKNPGYTANQVVESAPGMVAGGLAGRALMGAGRVAAPAARAGSVGPAVPGLAERALGQWAAPVAAGVGEGAVTAGQQMAQYQGEDQQTNALAALGAGVGTGVLGAGMGRVANRLGLETAETAIAKAGTGVAKAADDVPLSAKRRILGGMVSEALLQELPQSAQEQMWQNWADGKPLMDGVARAATEGAIAGGVMGAGANVSDGGAGKRRALAEQQAKQLSDAEAEALRADPSRAWTTEAGAADPNQPAGERAAPPEAPELQTIPGAAGPRDGLDFTRDVDTAGLTMQDPAEVERARAATMDYEPTDATPQWDTTRGAAQDRQPGLDMPAPEFDTGNFGFDTRAPSERIGLDPSKGSLTRTAAMAVDTGVSPVQFLGATGRDLQPRPTGPGVGNDGNIIDVESREVLDQRGISTPRRIANNNQPATGQQQSTQASQPKALPAPSNLREGLERIRQQRAEGERLASQSPATSSAVPMLGGSVGADRAGGAANAVPSGVVDGRAGGGSAEGFGGSLAEAGLARAGGRGNGNPTLTGESRNAQAAARQAAAAARAVSTARPGAVEAAGPATIPATTGVARESQASQAQQGSAQPAQTGGPQAGAATATASTSPAGGNRVQAAGLTNGAPTQNDGAQAGQAQGQKNEAQGPRVILQNRDRSTPSSIAQMRSIAANPDYGRLGFSRDFANGAPVVAGGTIEPTQLGRKDVATASDGRRIPVQYAVVEAANVLPSNRVDGTPNADYGQASIPAVRAIAGNGRIAGLQAAYQGGNAATYRQELVQDAALHGIDPAVISTLQHPVLVRVMPETAVTADIGDVSNSVGNMDLSAVEQANNDANRVSLDALQFAEDGSITQEAVRQFVRAMPQAEQGGLLDTNGQPTRQAVDRLNAAVFAKAYGNDDLVRLFAQAQDPEARNVLSALAQVAPKMARLEGAGALDIRELVAQAAEIAVNARRQGVALAKAARQLDMTADPDVGVILHLFAENPRSVRPVVESLGRMADMAYTEATKPAEDMFGAVPRASRADIINQLRPENERGSQEALENTAGREPVAVDAVGQANEPARPAALAEAQAGRAAEDGATLNGQVSEQGAEYSVRQQFSLFGQEEGDQLQLFIDNGPVPSQAGAGAIQAQRESIEALADMESAASILAKSLSRDYAARQRVSLVGQKVSTSEDLAVLAQVYRDPRFETFRLVFTDNAGNVVSQLGITSRLPASAEVIVGGDLVSYLRDVAAAATKTGATSYYMLHNHPSGQATPSGADIGLTRTFAQWLPGLTLRSHVVIDTNEYSVITSAGRVQKIQKDFPQTPSAQPSPMAGRQITSPQDVVQMAQSLQVDSGAITLIATDAQFRVKAITTVPPSILKGSKGMVRLRVARALMRLQSSNVFAVGRDDVQLRKLGGIVVDALHVSDSGRVNSLASQGLIASKTQGAFPNSRRPRVTGDSSEVFNYLRFDPATKQSAGARAVQEQQTKLDGLTSYTTEEITRGQDETSQADAETDKGVAMFSRTGAKSPNAQQPTSRAWYDRFVSLLPASYRNDPHRREPLPAEDWNVQRASEVRSKVEALNKQLRGADDRKGYGPVSVDGLGNLQVDARDVSVADLTGGIMALANELGAGIAATNVRSADARALQNSGFVSEPSLAAIADRLMQRPFASPTNNYAKDSAPGTVMTYKPRGFPAALFARDVAQNNATPARPTDSNARNVATQLLVDGLKAKWTRAPEIIVARNMQDPRVPQAVRDYDETLKSQGATGEARGFIYKGKVYLLSDELKGPQQIAEVLFHEVLGHYGLRGAFGESLTPILQQIGTMRRRDVVAKAREYGLFDKDALGVDPEQASNRQIWDAMTAQQRLEAAEEVLAELAQSRPEIGFVKRAVAAIRNWLRSNVPGFKSLRLTDADIVQKYLLPARRYVTRSKETGAQSLERAMAAFSRGTNGAMTSNDVVGNQGGRSADDYQPGTVKFNSFDNDERARDRLSRIQDVEEEYRLPNIHQAVPKDYVPKEASQKTVTIYRGVPTSVKDASIRPGDWVGLSKKYAADHGTGETGRSKVISIDVPADHVVWAGTDMNEWFYAPRQPNESTAPDSGGAMFSRTPGDQTQTEAFKRWFAGSRVVDADGKPMVVYHGTTSEFNTFRVGNAPGWGRGIYFTDNESVARDEYAGDDGVVVAAYVSLQNPYTGQHITEAQMEATEAGQKVLADGRNVIDASNEDGRFFGSMLRELGYDGVMLKGSNNIDGYEIVAFRPEQIKSATGNRGTFDPTNPDIRFSRTSTATATQSAWDAPVQAGFDDVIYKLQDKNIDLKRVVEAITKATGQVADSINAYLKEELFHKRAAKRVADFGDRELKPLMNKMRLAGLSMEDVEEYLHARHAKEANAVIAQRNPGNAGLQDGGSGMTNAAADNYFSKLDPVQRRKLEAVAKSVDAIIEGTRKLYVSYGLEDQAVVDGWANMYQHYIPLMREDKDGGMGTGQGFSVKGKETKGRTGSTRKVVDILANVAMQREKLIVRGEKNIVAQALVGLAQANPNPDFWEVRSQAPTERVFDPKTGVVVDRPDPLFKSRENVAVAKVKDANGKVTEQMVVFNEDNPRAVRMAAAMKNLDAGNLEGLLGVSAKITRYFAAINTQYNPVFGVVNLVRDVQGAMVNLGTTPLAGQQGKIAKDTLSALRGIYGDIRKTRKGGQATSQWSQLWEQMQDDGGTTGYRDLFKTSADRANDLKSILNPEGWMDSKWGKFFTADGRLKVPLSMAQKGATEIFGWLSDYNEAMENGVRLAAYKAALDKGMSREQAASLAKNLTVNFNRKGQAGMQAGAVYAFFNAAMQGTARIGQTLFDMDGGDLSTLRLSKTGKAVVYGGVMLGVMQALALSAAGFDDDDPPEFVRERSLIIPTGGKTYVSIPMPLGLHVIPGIGRHATEFALSGFDKPAKRAVSMVGMFADAFNPIGNAGLSMQTIAPTALDPLVALSENKDWTGKPIARVSSNKAMPGHTQWKDTATGFSKVVAEAINWISGGNEYVAGAFSPTPDQIDYLLAQVGGGVAREAAKVQQTITTALSGETLPTHKIPLVGRFVGNAASQASQGSAFYANLNKLNELETEIKGLRKDGRFDEAAKLIRENPQAIMIAMANRAERDVQRLRREKRELIANDASREQVRAKEDQITDVMTRLNEAVERRKAQAAR